MPLMTPEEVAERWRLKPRTVRELIRTRRLPGLHVGRVIRIREEDVEALERGGLVVEGDPSEGRVMNGPEHACQADQFVSMYCRLKGPGELAVEFQRWADTKDFGQEDRLAIEGEVRRLLTATEAGGGGR